MLCESCRSGDTQCNAWIACARQVAFPEPPEDHSEPRVSADPDLGCSLAYEVGYDEDQPYVEPRRVLVCQVHP